MKDFTAAIITASDRAARGIYQDESGELLSQGLESLGFEIISKEIFPDLVEEISRGIASALKLRVDLILTTGGTGISTTDVTPEATAPYMEKLLPGISESLRAYGRVKTPFADLSRGLAGVNGKTVIINLPGSPNAVRDGLVILEQILPHLMSQLSGQVHP